MRPVSAQGERLLEDIVRASPWEGYKDKENKQSQSPQVSFLLSKTFLPASCGLSGLCCLPLWVWVLRYNHLR